MKEYIIKTKRPKIFYFIYNSIRFTLFVLFKILFRTEFIGKEKIPLKGRLIVCCNHISYLDPVIIDIYFPRPVFFMAKVEIFKLKFLANFFTYFNTFPVNRNVFDRQAVRSALEVLEDGCVFGMFPEGTRSPDGVILEGQKGIGMIAARSRSDILPVAISGTNKIIRKPHKRLFFPKIRIIFGDLVETGPIISSNSNKDASQIIISKTMKSIKELYERINI